MTDSVHPLSWSLKIKNHITYSPEGTAATAFLLLRQFLSLFILRKLWKLIEMIKEKFNEFF